MVGRIEAEKSIGPLSQGSLDQTLRFAVRLSPIRTGPEVAKAPVVRNVRSVVRLRCNHDELMRTERTTCELNADCGPYCAAPGKDIHGTPRFLIQSRSEGFPIRYLAEIDDHVLETPIDPRRSPLPSGRSSWPPFGLCSSIVSISEHRKFWEDTP